MRSSASNDELEEKWWEKPDEEEEEHKPTVEELLEKIERLRLAQRNVPKGLLFKQFLALVYVTVNAIFMYVSIRSPSAGYIAAYMVPLTILMLDYFVKLGELKRIAMGEEDENKREIII